MWCMGRKDADAFFKLSMLAMWIIHWKLYCSFGCSSIFPMMLDHIQPYQTVFTNKKYKY